MERRDVMRILDKMAKTAQVPRILDDDDFAFFESRLAGYGWPQVYDALQKLRESMTRLPTVAEIKSAMGIAAPLSAEKTIEAQCAAALVAMQEAFSRFGYTDCPGARAHVGEVCWKAMGGARGWIDLCQTDSSSELGIRKAHIREAMKALLLLPADKLPGMLMPPEPPAIDHAAARLESAKKQLADAKALLRIVTEAETDKQTSKVIRLGGSSERK